MNQVNKEMVKKSLMQQFGHKESGIHYLMRISCDFGREANMKRFRCSEYGFEVLVERKSAEENYSVRFMDYEEGVPARTVGILDLSDLKKIKSHKFIAESIWITNDSIRFGTEQFGLTRDKLYNFKVIKPILNEDEVHTVARIYFANNDGLFVPYYTVPDYPAYLAKLSVKKNATYISMNVDNKLCCDLVDLFSKCKITSKKRKMILDAFKECNVENPSFYVMMFITTRLSQYKN